MSPLCFIVEIIEGFFETLAPANSGRGKNSDSRDP